MSLKSPFEATMSKLIRYVYLGVNDNDPHNTMGICNNRWWASPNGDFHTFWVERTYSG